MPYLPEISSILLQIVLESYWLVIITRLVMLCLVMVFGPWH